MLNRLFLYKIFKINTYYYTESSLVIQSTIERNDWKDKLDI